MMEPVLIGIILILSGLLYRQHYANRKRSHQLRRVHDKLSRILADDTGEKLLLFTEDPELRLILIDINRVLEYNQRILAERTGTEQSIRRMLSNISHDLKTPLTVVLGYIETIRLDPDMIAEERAELLVKVHRKAYEVIEMIGQFFDLAKLESGDQPMPLTRVHLNEVCRRNMLAFYDVLTGKGIKVELKIPDEPLYAYANENALDRILNNLISNAIRYGSEGNVIGLTLRQEREQVCVDIWDQGKGIGEIHQNKVFERMYTLEDSRNKSYQGSGLGLTITRRLAQNMGGDITLYSRPYEKTIFTVQLKPFRY
ncbi:signal transduction histidine kinase [Fontibacillus phaseoli]|uniref:histidine kinase n=1 Tax=Fontibacillus phaseoli TaxID=1416533 RepID=A0A369BCA9_9BACL|nr:signal transduction histidine kinase [Fontibacillus phaseoli]